MYISGVCVWQTFENINNCFDKISACYFLRHYGTYGLQSALPIIEGVKSESTLDCEDLPPMLNWWLVWKKQWGKQLNIRTTYYMMEKMHNVFTMRYTVLESWQVVYPPSTGGIPTKHEIFRYGGIAMDKYEPWPIFAQLGYPWIHEIMVIINPLNHVLLTNYHRHWQ